MDSPEQMPPAAARAERCILGAMLRDNHWIADAVTTIEHPELFHADANQKVYRAIVDLWDSGKPADLTTVAALLEQRGQAADVGYPYLGELWDDAPSGHNIEHYARLVRDKAISRKVLHTAVELQGDAADGLMPADELLEKAEREILAIGELGVEGDSRHVADVMREVSDRIDQRASGGDCGIPTGYLDLDRLLCGLRDGEVTLIAARTSVGKTAFALGIARHLAVDLSLPVLFVSLEQSAEELGERLLCLETGIDSHKLKSGSLTDDEVHRLIAGKSQINEAPLFIDEQTARGMTRIAANTRRHKARKGIKALFLDYVQLVTPENKKDPRQEQVASISRRLKHIARELQIPVIALAQLNRESEKRTDRKPRLSDLRESDALAHDADVVILLSPAEAEDKQDETAVRQPCIEIIVDVAKHRNGPTGTVRMIFRRACMRFEHVAIGRGEA
jgi:replicative DNA helicase